jgi:inorganic pyrophosphatase
MWHNLDLHSKSLFSNDTGLYHYVNEMPLGSLQKFEMMPDEVENIIIEDERGSRGLAAFGYPVPFNYGCLPQTFRDPEQVDQISGVGGDNDPLDVLDLCPMEVGPGVVVTCRPLGAVCLIDEGEADWKILAVNVNSTDPLSSAKSVDDVELLRPGRVQEVLQWMDDFKKMSSAEPGSAVLHFEIHDAERANTIIETDHVSWQKLVALEPDANGFVKGHWTGTVRAPPTEVHVWSSTKQLPFMVGTLAPRRMTETMVCRATQ